MVDDKTHQTHEDFYEILKGYAKQNEWLKFQCFLTISDQGDLVLFDPQLHKEAPTQN